MPSFENMLTVAELIELLQDKDPDAHVIIACDSEGNSYSPINKDLGDGVYEPEGPTSGDLHPGRELTLELEELGFSEEDCYDEPDGIDVIVIYPTN